MEINIGESYTELGATATDDIDGDITQNIIVDSSNLNTTLAGNYSVTYSVSDSSNNSTSEQREVIVIDDSIGNCDGIEYASIIYGTQEWTVEHSCHTTYRDGTAIPQVTDNEEWTNLTTGAWCYYGNDPTKGRLYNWYAVMGIHDADSLSDASLRKEFAPEGWHVPTRDEFLDLEYYLIANGYNYDGTTTVNKIAKSMASTTGWNTSDAEGAPGNDQSLNNSSGFNARPVGFRYYSGQFADNAYNDYEIVYFWTTTVWSTNTNIVWNYSLTNRLSFSFDGGCLGKGEGKTVRFVKD